MFEVRADLRQGDEFSPTLFFYIKESFIGLKKAIREMHIEKP